MVGIIADTNVWLRSVDPRTPHHAVAAAALAEISIKARLFLVPQNLIEFWVVATRPAEANGLGWAPEQAASLLKRLRETYEMKPDAANLIDVWRDIVQTHHVRGKRAHDARLAAAVITTGADYLVTFNVPDFFSWPINAVLPETICALLSST